MLTENISCSQFVHKLKRLKEEIHFMTQFELLKHADIPMSQKLLCNVELSPSGKIFLGEIIFCCKNFGFYNLTNLEIAELYRMTDTSASLWVKDLLDRGYIRSELNMGSSKRKRTIYLTKKGEEMSYGKKTCVL